MPRSSLSTCYLGAREHLGNRHWHGSYWSWECFFSRIVVVFKMLFHGATSRSKEFVYDGRRQSIAGTRSARHMCFVQHAS